MDTMLIIKLQNALEEMTSQTPKSNKKKLVAILQEELGLDVVERLGVERRHHTAVYFKNDENGKAKYQFYIKQIDKASKYPRFTTFTAYENKGEE